jgi:hypothetical protein
MESVPCNSKILTLIELWLIKITHKWSQQMQLRTKHSIIQITIIVNNTTKYCITKYYIIYKILQMNHPNSSCTPTYSLSLSLAKARLSHHLAPPPFTLIYSLYFLGLFRPFLKKYYTARLWSKLDSIQSGHTACSLYIRLYWAVKMLIFWATWADITN